jgi:hypothetical protein
MALEIHHTLRGAQATSFYKPVNYPVSGVA